MRLLNPLSGVFRLESLIRVVLGMATGISLLTTITIIILLFTESAGFFHTVDFYHFITGTVWTPFFIPRQFGVLPLVYGTCIIAVGACLIAVPCGVTIAIYLSEFTHQKIATWIKPCLEILAGIPTVVYGYFALVIITPSLQYFSPHVHIFNALSAMIVVAIMILPMIATLSDDAIKAVPNHLRYAGYAMGATDYEVVKDIVLPSASSGIIASVLLALSRALGETMAVTMAAGATPRLSLNIFDSVQTMTAYIVQVSLGDTPQGGIAHQTLYVVATLLFIITLLINIVSNIIFQRYRLQQHAL